MADWPIREGLLCLLAQRRAAALESYRFEILQYCLTAPHTEKKNRPKQPKPPDILKDPPRAKE